MGANVFFFAGGNCQLRADRELRVRLNPRDQREVFGKGCKPHARARTAVTSSAQCRRWRRSHDARHRGNDGRPKRTCGRTVGKEACRSTLWHTLTLLSSGVPMLMDAVPMSVSYTFFREPNVKFSLAPHTHATHRSTAFRLTPRAAIKRRSEGDRYTGDRDGTRGRSGVNGSDQVEVRCDFGLRHQFKCVSENCAENHIGNRFELVVAVGSLCTWHYSR